MFSLVSWTQLKVNKRTELNEYRTWTNLLKIRKNPLQREKWESNIKSKLQMLRKMRIRMLMSERWDNNSCSINFGTPLWDRKWLKKWKHPRALMKLLKRSRPLQELQMFKSLFTSSLQKSRPTLNSWLQLPTVRRELIRWRVKTNSWEHDFMSWRLELKLARMIIKLLLTLRKSWRDMKKRPPSNMKSTTT